MSEKITHKDLYHLCDILNRINGTSESNAFFVQWAYGRPRLHQNVGAGIRDVSPRLSTSQLYTWMHAYIDGLTYQDLNNPVNPMID